MVELLVEEVPHVTVNQEANSSWIQGTSHKPSEPHPCIVFSPGRPHFLRAPLHPQEAACGRRTGTHSTHLWLVFQINWGSLVPSFFATSIILFSLDQESTNYGSWAKLCVLFFVCVAIPKFFKWLVEKSKQEHFVSCERHIQLKLSIYQ